MKQPFPLNHEEIEIVAAEADRMCEWLDDESVRESTQSSEWRIRIPSGLAVVNTITLVYGITVFLDSNFPANLCWFGGCFT